jgi:hypothetical protein
LPANVWIEIEVKLGTDREQMRNAVDEPASFLGLPPLLSLIWNKAMQHQAKSIRAFIGAKNFPVSQKFYRDLGFTEHLVSPDMSYFETEGMGFYLQDAYVRDWVDNTMLFMEVDGLERHWNELNGLELPAKYENVRLSPIRTEHWGKEYFLHDPSGILWHFGEFRK